jgi:hypothetical protein
MFGLFRIAICWAAAILDHLSIPFRGQKFAVLKLSTFGVCRYHWTTRIFKLRHCGYA